MSEHRLQGSPSPPVGQSPDNSACEDRLQAWFDQLPEMSEECRRRHQRPLVTISYAQSLDGSIASRNREPLQLSSRASMVLTHRIRAACDAILIGINTLLVDNPLLTVRLIEGPNPQPIILDSHLRAPLHARVFERTDHGCWLACTENHDPAQRGALIGRGAQLLRCRSDRRGRVDLTDLLRLLSARGIRNIMVEGGSQVITSFLEARLVDQMIITIAPNLVGGLPVLDQPVAGNGTRLHLSPISFQTCGPDMILWAQPQWQES
ncbi:MAG: RibD family protein [Desulfobacteraceae bacterium]|nr:RibD family protein [Desulfobacteraceae bacterium]